jgi:hypothetical protein
MSLQTRIELLAAANAGISEYLRSTRGARLQAGVVAVGGGVLMISCRAEDGTTEHYSLKVKKSRWVTK